MPAKNDAMQSLNGTASSSTSSTTSTPLLDYSNITLEQQDAITRLVEFDSTLLIASKGFGKHVVGQTAAQELLEDNILKRILVVAPPKVARLTWGEEYKLWDHLWTPGMALGDAKQRRGVIEGAAEIVVISADTVAWFVDTYGRNHGFDGLLIDEVHRFKSAGGKAFKKLRSILPAFKWRAGLTATAVTESGTAIYSQALLLDSGAALGTRQDLFLARYFLSDFTGYKFEFMPGAQERLAHALRDLVWIAPDTEYASELVPLDDDIIYVDMPQAGYDAYEEMAQTMVLEAADTEAVNSGVLVGKLQQIANGWIYDAEKWPHTIHLAKQKALWEHVQGLDEPVIIVYNYIEDREMMRQLFPEAVCLADDPEGAQAAWNAGEIDVLLLHPRSGGAGLNLQHGGRYMIMYGPIWSADQSDQTIGRLRRRGQTKTVCRRTIVCRDTIDQVILDRVDTKHADENILMNHIRDAAARNTKAPG